MAQINVEERVRAWALIETTDPQTVAKDVLGLDDGDILVVIRADEVYGGPTNVVASIDAAKDYYDQTTANISAINGITNLSFLRVKNHEPYPPNNASGYITAEELSKSDSDRAYQGRQDKSPGLNPWG